MPMTRRGVTILLAVAALGAAHFLLARDGHLLHALHVGLGAAYLVPVIAAALWLSRAGALCVALVSAALYLVHARVSWAGQPYENANQAAMATVYVVVALVTASLVSAREAERRRGTAAVLAAQRDAAIQAVASLSSALRHRDDGTAEHCHRVARLCSAIGRALALADDQINLLTRAALVHDVGKIGVRDDVLFKPGALTPEERALIERHPSIAADLLAPIAGAGEIARIVRAHHENPDGTGYPDRLAGSAIPVEARILRVADVFDALAAARSYKSPMPDDRALAAVEDLAAHGKVDAAAAAALRRVLGRQGA